MPDLTLRDIQHRAWRNKVTKGFNITDVPLEFGLLYGEVAEAFDAWRKNPPAVGGELADVLIFLLSLAQMTGTDLQDAVEAKLAAIEARVYECLANGTHVKAGES
jgi:NTP pyrophosphatase (non-canonical NTP hydrolase)